MMKIQYLTIIVIIIIKLIVKIPYFCIHWERNKSFFFFKLIKKKKKREHQLFNNHNIDLDRQNYFIIAYSLKFYFIFFIIKIELNICLFAFIYAQYLFIYLFNLYMYFENDFIVAFFFFIIFLIATNQLFAKSILNMFSFLSLLLLRYMHFSLSLSFDCNT